jgi:hypothetical protein
MKAEASMISGVFDRRIDSSWKTFRRLEVDETADKAGLETIVQ